MGFFNNDNQTITGTKTNCIIALVCGIAGVVLSLLGIFLPWDMLIWSLLAFGVGIWQCRKAMHSNEVKLRRFALVAVGASGVTLAINALVALIRAFMNLGG